ncbi:MAG: ABC transporter permease [Roseburia sp.]|nr:ABC transporter permease [Roseburia sp.]MCM1280071.1 ABC transporter permease [Robinsoniella sp.]
MTLYKHEMKMNKKSLFLWTLCVGFTCLGCILLYTSLEDSVKDIADSFSDMGSMSTALGMDKMSLATLRGYYATEIAIMHNLLGAIFAAILGTGLLSKEEAGHTSEFLHTFPIGRSSIVFQKYLAFLSNILIFNLICAGMYLLGFLYMKEEINGKEMAFFHFATSLMQIEIGTICFLISSFTKRNLLGAGLGTSIMLFAADMMCRIVPAIENLKYVTPFYYSNAADIFTDGKLNGSLLTIGAMITAVSFGAAWLRYCSKDLAP